MKRLIKWNFNRKFGIEYEFNNKSTKLDCLRDKVAGSTRDHVEVRRYEHTNDNYNTWVCKTDSSCGIELVSPILHGPNDLKKVAEILTVLKDEGFRINNKCGQHVHIYVGDFTEMQIGTIAAYWMKIERFILNGTPNHRRTNDYCSLLTQKHIHILAHQEYDPLTVLRTMATGRDAANFLGVSNRKTVEFRFGEMTFDPEVIKNRVRFLIWFVEMCKILPAPNNLNWMSPKQIMKTFNLWKTDNKIIEYEYSSAIQSMRKWLLSRVIEFAPKAFEKDIIACKKMLAEIKNEEISTKLEEEYT